MVSTHRSLALALSLVSMSQQVAAFDRDVCLKSAQRMLGNGTLALDSPFLFRDQPGSPPYIGANNFTLTLAGCNAICGPKQTWYSDTGPRINAWVLPVLLLLINVEVGPCGKHNLLGYLHLLGDPIDSLWSLIHKIDAWGRCYDHAEQLGNLCLSCRLIIATVLAGHEEVQGPRVTHHHNSLDNLINHFQLLDHFPKWRRAAVHLAGGRTNELVRTTLALLLFLYQLIANWVPAVGGLPTSIPSKSRIATAVLLSCFVPIIVLTNLAGAFATRRTAYNIMSNLSIETSGHALQIKPRHSVFLRWMPYLARDSTSNSYEAFPWSGGIYMYRPWKLQYITMARSPSKYSIFNFLLAATPVIIGLIGGSLVLWWQTPKGFNCRHIWLISVSLLWICSAMITQISNNLSFATGKYHWRFVLIKDALVALPSFLIFFLSTSGLFNYCWCWSGPWEYPGTGRVILPTTFFESDGTVMYPMTLGAALYLQLSIVVFIWLYWKPAFRVLRWKKEVLQEESDRVARGEPACRCIVRLRQERQRYGIGAMVAPLLNRNEDLEVRQHLPPIPIIANEW